MGSGMQLYYPMEIEFISFQDCPNSPAMLQSLREALNALGLKDRILRVDLYQLAAARDLRAGYGSPTILVNGKDLFGAPIPDHVRPACRFYGKALPDTNEIIEKIRPLKK